MTAKKVETRYVTAPEAAGILGITKQGVHHLERCGKLKRRRTVGRARVREYLRSDVEALKKERKKQRLTDKRIRG